jgi:DNA-binding CsgD family transcriptional regulator
MATWSARAGRPAHQSGIFRRVSREAWSTEAFLEAAYRGDGSEAEWLEGILEICAPTLDRGLGVAAYAWDFTDHDHPTITELCGRGFEDPSWPATALAAHLRMPHAQRLELYRRGPSTSSSQAYASARDRYVTSKDMRTRYAGRDFAAVIAAEPTLRGVAFVSPSERLITAADVPGERWERVAAHVGAAMRLRRELDSQARLDDAAAVLDDAGRFEHLAKDLHLGDARELSEAARTLGSLRALDADRALEHWRGLVAGRFSVVRHFERDGKRYLVARRNEVEGDAFAALSERTRHVLSLAAMGRAHKQIAYELGISAPTVSRELRKGMALLGLRTKSELCARFDADVAGP